jgi:hypothetical protein
MVGCQTVVLFSKRGLPCAHGFVVFPLQQFDLDHMFSRCCFFLICELYFLYLYTYIIVDILPICMRLGRLMPAQEGHAYVDRNIVSPSSQ